MSQREFVDYLSWTQPVGGILDANYHWNVQFYFLIIISKIMCKMGQ